MTGSMFYYVPQTRPINTANRHRNAASFSSYLIHNYGFLEHDAVYFRIQVIKFRTNLTYSHIQATRAKADGGKAIGYVGVCLSKAHGVISRTTALLTVTALSASHRTTKSGTLQKKYLRGEVQLHAFLRSTPDRTQDPVSHPSSFTMGGRGKSPW